MCDEISMARHYNSYLGQCSNGQFIRTTKSRITGAGYPRETSTESTTATTMSSCPDTAAILAQTRQRFMAAVITDAAKRWAPAEAHSHADVCRTIKITARPKEEGVVCFRLKSRLVICCSPVHHAFPALPAANLFFFLHF
ncbi:hypothetical protein IF2G_02770 [Cordyceps javanica]|nr:hypothetical protein IF2G_02770 [Cordyceps javanica]